MSNKNEHWDKIAAYMALTPEQRRDVDRAEYPYLPTPALMLSAGYVEEWLGLWQHRPLPAMWPLYEVAFSQRGFCDVSYAEQPHRGHLWSYGRLVSSDEELLQWLREKGLPAW